MKAKEDAPLVWRWTLAQVRAFHPSTAPTAASACRKQLLVSIKHTSQPYNTLTWNDSKRQSPMRCAGAPVLQPNRFTVVRRSYGLVDYYYHTIILKSQSMRGLHSRICECLRRLERKNTHTLSRNESHQTCVYPAVHVTWCVCVCVFFACCTLCLWSFAVTKFKLKGI